MTNDNPEAAKETICLDQFLKLSGIAGTGGQAKVLIQGGEVSVNGIVETRRRRKLYSIDTVEFQDIKLLVSEVLTLG